MPTTTSGRHTTWAMAVIAVAAVAAASVTAGVSGTVPHDLIALALVAMGFIAGNKTGQLQERLHGNGNAEKWTCKYTPDQLEAAYERGREGGDVSRGPRPGEQRRPPDSA